MSPTCSLGVSWAALSAHVQATNTLAQWSATEAVLTGIATLDQLAQIVHCGVDQACTDEVFGALVRLAAVDGGDDQDAAMLVAHLLATGTRKIALALRDLTGDIDVLVAGQLWLQIRSFPWRRRTRAYASSLLLDTRRAVLAELRPYRSRAGRDPVLLVNPIGAGSADGPAGAQSLTGVVVDVHDRDESGLVDVLVWAHRTGVVDSSDVALLIDLVAAAERRTGPGHRAHRGVNVTGEIAEVAAQRGVHPKTIWRHRARVLSALRAASQDYLAAVA